MGKSFGEVISPVPEAGLAKKESPVNAKKKNCKAKIKFIKNVKILEKKKTVGLHLAQRISFAR